MPQLTVDGDELAFDAQGMGRPLVLLHGVGSARQTWRPQVDARHPNEVLRGADMRAVARTVTVATLVLVGELDCVTPPELSAELGAWVSNVVGSSAPMHPIWRPGFCAPRVRIANARAPVLGAGPPPGAPGHRISRRHYRPRLLASLIPLARPAVILGAGHLSNEENPDAFNAELCRLLGTTVEASNG